jgi:hypothetical protein
MLDKSGRENKRETHVNMMLFAFPNTLQKEEELHR